MCARCCQHCFKWMTGECGLREVVTALTDSLPYTDTDTHTHTYTHTRTHARTQAHFNLGKPAGPLIICKFQSRSALSY